MAKREVGWWYRIAVNGRDTFRQRMGGAVRLIADRIDGRHSLAIELLSVPPVSRSTQQDIIGKGVTYMGGLLEESAHAEAIDALMVEACPQLYDETE